MEKTLPCNIDAEECLLGSLLIDTVAMDEVSPIVHAEDFYRAKHKHIFEAMCAVLASGESVDIMSVYNAMLSRGTADEDNDLLYLNSLSFHPGVPTARLAPQYAMAVKHASIQRQLIHAAGQIAAIAYERADAGEALEKAESLINGIARGVAPTEAADIETLALDTLTKLNALKSRPRGYVAGVPSGFTRIDFLTGGWQRADLIIAAGRPSMGKSAFMLSMAYHAALRSHKRILIFSLEMSKENLMHRLIAMDAQVDSQLLRLGRLTADEWDRVDMALGRLSELGDLILIDDTQGLTPVEMRSRARRHHAKHPLDIVMVDYLQRMKAEKNGKRIDDPTQEIGEISTELKSLAIEMDIPVLALAQLNREVEKRQDKRPQLSDLAQSGKIEQDADLILFLYRDDYYNKETMRPGIADIIIAKHRNGPCDEVALHFEAKYTQFGNLEVQR